MKAERRVVVTGLGLATPAGIGADAFWDAQLHRRGGVAPITAFDASGLGCRIAGQLPPHSVGDYVPKTYRKNNKVMSVDTRIAVICAHRAALDARLNTACLIARGEARGPSNVDPARFGVNIGAGLVCADLPELAGALNTAAEATDDGTYRFSHVKWGREGMSNLTPLWLLKFLPNMPACHVTIVHDAQAPSNTITCGEASSHLAIGEAFRTIARGDADACICGGAESKVNPMAMARPLLLGRLNTRDNDAPRRACRPFGADAAGTVLSEGGGLVILEALEHATARGARVYAEIVGFGASTNTSSWREPDPTGDPIALALRAALADARVKPDSASVLVPFGAGIQAYDAAEAAGWRQVFGDGLRDARAVCTKGLIGINGAGSGAIDFATAATCLYLNTIPPSVNTDDLDPACGLTFVQEEPVDANADHAITCAYALSGSQVAALVLRKFGD